MKKKREVNGHRWQRNHGKSRVVRWVQHIVLSALLLCVMLASHASAVETRHVLVLHSYHSGMSWVNNIENAVRETLLVPPLDDLILHYEYMDTKRYHSDAYYEKLRKIFKEKYGELHFAAVLSSDNNAFDFLRKYRDEIFHDAPVIFCGVNNFTDEWLDGLSNFTGVAEIMSSRDTVEAILHQLPDTKEIYVINDYLKTGRAWQATIARNLKAFEDKVRIEYNENLSIAELREKIQSMKPGTVVLLGVYYSDRNGRYLTYEKLGTMLTVDSPVPVYCLLRFNLRDGVIGGKVISGYHQGAMMSEVARRVLMGEKADDIPVVQIGANAFIFDWQGMAKHGITVEMLPKESVVLNEPFSFYDEYYHLVWATVAVFATMVALVVFLSRNIAALRVVRKELSYSERKFRSIFNNAHEGVFQTSFDGRTLSANQAHAAIFGYDSPEEMIDKVNDVRENLYVNSEDRDKVLKAVREKGKISGLELWMKRKDGSKLLINLNIRITETPDGEPILEGSLVNITERKRVADELAKLRNYLFNIIDSMPSILVGIDKECRVTLWNRTAEETTGIPVSEADGRTLTEVLPRMKSVMNEVEESIRLRKFKHIQKLSHQGQTGMHYEDVTVYPLVTGASEGAVVRLDDVTDRINLERMMIQSEKMMSLGGLAAGMAHEINNPLAAVIGYAHNIRKRVFGDLKKNFRVAEECDVPLERVREYLTRREVISMLDGIDDSGARAAKIVSNMLNFSRKSELDTGGCNLTEILDKAVELAANVYDMKKQYDFNRIEIVREYEDNLPGVRCDGNEIQQVFLNLLKNGSEAMAEKKYEDESPRIILRAYKSGDNVAVEVEDNGPGMDESVRRRILEPFFTTKPVGSGTGLGLSVSYFIVADLHDGSMEVFSEPGEWTRFRVSLPLYECEKDAE
ncbi:ABC transporter substrate binding protein [Pseudodesulfovibrio sp. zrk46]|uniref:ABC transporter substrate binding protein n=1 Tax=Pseudodesulfovibrio sp. zrk46 TaxID=2725288 RepID=UPI001449D476|nr:ABC transporter substrate binding protein [Pseudodesulfovibrio sp. zrk46]QJB56659.1 PAS domain S-box protein [Pseudodesulfovibrio sp. zrk46]